jgi:hypothetical protein
MAKGFVHQMSLSQAGDDSMESAGGGLQTATLVQMPNGTESERAIQIWSAPTKVGFRFFFILFSLFFFAFPLDYTPFLTRILDLYNKPWQPLVLFTARHALRIDQPLTQNGISDTTWCWIQAFWILTIAVTGSIIWTALDRKRPNYSRLYQWLTIFIRFGVAAAMFAFGMAKVIPNQMPPPQLTKLLEPYGNSTPMGVLWSFMGSSQAYEIFTGCVETVGGLLLIFPRTAILGAMVAAAAMLQVWMLNMCYDVPVKLYSFQLLVESVFLTAPYLPRLLELLVFQSSPKPRTTPPLFAGKKANRAALAVQISFGLILLGYAVVVTYGDAHDPRGLLATRPPLYGIWNVEEFSVDGQVKPPLLTDTTRMRRLIFQNPQYLVIQPMDGPGVYYQLSLDADKQAMEIKKRGQTDADWRADFTYQQPDPKQLVLDGEMDGHKIHAKLDRYDESKFLLRSRGFRWSQDFSFNR